MSSRGKSDMQFTMGKKRWSDLTPVQRAWIVLSSALQVALLVAALVDLRCRPQEEIKGSKRLWTALVFINWIGPIAYFVFGRKRAGARHSWHVRG